MEKVVCGVRYGANPLILKMNRHNAVKTSLQVRNYSLKSVS